MKTIPLEEAKQMPCSELLQMAWEHNGIVLTESGEKRYFIGAIDELAMEAHTLSQNLEFMAYLEACLARGDREGNLSLAEARKRWGVE